MKFWELFVLAIGLSMDAFAVSLCKGMSMKRLSVKNALITALPFGMAHAFMLLIGWLIGSELESTISKYDHIVVFVLLLFIGSKMIWETLTDKESDSEIYKKQNLWDIIVLSIATSIDVLAVGVSFALLPHVNIEISALVIGVVVFAVSFIGVVVGNKFGYKLKRKAEVFGGVVLILIGLKILVEHLSV